MNIDFVLLGEFGKCVTKSLKTHWKLTNTSNGACLKYIQIYDWHRNFVKLNLEMYSPRPPTSNKFDWGKHWAHSENSRECYLFLTPLGRNKTCTSREKTCISDKRIDSDSWKCPSLYSKVWTFEENAWEKSGKSGKSTLCKSYSSSHVIIACFGF